MRPGSAHARGRSASAERRRRRNCRRSKPRTGRPSAGYGWLRAWPFLSGPWLRHLSAKRRLCCAPCVPHPARPTDSLLMIMRISESLSLGLAQHLACDLEQIVRNASQLERCIELRPHQGLALRIVAPPGLEGAGHAGGDLGIDLVQRSDRFSDKGIAAAVGAVETQMVARKGADQCAHAVRILDIER